MSRSLRWRTVALIAIVLACVGVLVPTVVGPRALPSWYPFRTTIHLGLDLEGGAHIVYGIDLDQAVSDRASTIKRDLEARLADERIAATVKVPARPIGGVTVVPEAAASRARVVELVAGTYGDVLVDIECPPSEPARAACYRVGPAHAETIRRSALANAVSIIRDRIDEKGIAEPSVVERGNEIIVELPGLDPALIAETRSVISRAAKLEFKVVDSDSEYMRRLFARVGSDDEGLPTDPRARELGIRAEIEIWQPEGGEQRADVYLIAPEREAIERYVAELAAADPSFRIPDDRQLAFERVEPEGEEPYWRTWYLDRTTQLTGASIADVAGAYDPNTNRPIVLLDFTREGARVFGELTTRIVGERLATLLDGRVRSAPIINEPILGGRASITLGSGDPLVQERERDELVNVLRTGSLPAPLREESASEIGPTLGHDAVEKAKLAFAVGIGIVVIILVAIYRTSGALALVTLTLNTMFVLVLLVLFEATLTLPGIAGIVLTFGMAVDGNIIIFERIREELARNKSLRGAVDIGYSRALSAIVDGQLTTMAGGFVLLVYGTGPITGFAVTLIMGNVTALFANIWCTRVLQEHYLRYLRKRGKPIAI